MFTDRGPRNALVLAMGVFWTVLCLPTPAGGQEAATASETQPVDQAMEDAVRMTRPGVFELHCQGLDLRRVLQLLSTQGRQNIIATKEVTGTVTADLYGVTFQEALEAVLRSSNLVHEKKGNFIYVYTPEQYAAIRKAEMKMVVRVFRLSYITAADARALLAPALSPEGAIEVPPAASMGIETSSTVTGGNSYATEDVLVVHDYEENVERIAELVAELDVRPEQVLIEATLLRATLTENNSLGVDFNTLAGIDFQSLDSSSPGIQSLTTGDMTADTWNNRAATVRTDFNAAIGTGGMTIGFIANEVAFFIRALESVSDVTVMANPKLLVVNKQRGEVMLGNSDGYLTTTVTETVATQSVEFLDTGTRLIVRPFIGKDGYIRMEIHPEDSSGSVQQIGNFVLPSKTTTEVTSNVLVRDGHTIIIGGLFREQTTNGGSQVPLLGNIPYAGVLFRSTTDQTRREEMIICITPRIIKQEDDEATSEELKEDMERMRVGQRKGMQWWGRSRLAQAHMRWARQHLRDGEVDKALWDVDMALSLEPRMMEAIKLKERLTDRAYWHDQPRHSAIKYIIQRMIMNELGRPVDEVITPDKPLDVNEIHPDARKAMGIKKEPQTPLPELARPKVPGQQSLGPDERLRDQDEDKLEAGSIEEDSPEGEEDTEAQTPEPEVATPEE